ncbi:MAG: NAD(P)/FAD-dependent oxidoreductase [Pseudomonadota bacterium]
MINRRRLLTQLSLTGLVPLAGCATLGEQRARVVVIGGGFGGATMARSLKLAAPQLRVTLIEPRQVYTACPFSNLVIGANRPLSAQQFGFAGVAAAGVEVKHDTAVGVDAVARTVTLASATRIAYDKLVLAPGIELDFTAIPGYDREASRLAPHAWQAGEQTVLLRDQLRAMPAGGTFVMLVPDSPYRCPPGPYERASLVAHYLHHHNPAAKVLILDNKDAFSKQALFQQGWQSQYGDLIEWQGVADGAAVSEVDVRNKVIHTDFDSVQYDVANVIPPQRAGRIARMAGATDASGWCPIDPATFASTLLNDTYVLGDAAIANAMPKSAFAANAQAKYCAVQVLRALRDLPPLSSTLANTCYSLVSPQYAISIAGVYQADETSWRPVPGAGGTSPLTADPAVRLQEANYADSWFSVVTNEVYG